MSDSLDIALIQMRSGIDPQRNLDDAAALFARQFYFGLVQGNSVRVAFNMAKDTISSDPPSQAMPEQSV